MESNLQKEMQLRTTIRASYDVRGWEHFGEAFQAAYTDIYKQYNEYLAEELEKVAGPGNGPGPHPHRADRPQVSRKDDDSKERYNFRWLDTGNLIKSVQVDPQPRREGYRLSWHTFTDLPYGAYLEIGFHPKIPVKMTLPDGSEVIGFQRQETFYRYPWLSIAMNAVHQKVVRDMRRIWGKTMLNPKFRLAGTRRGMSRNVSDSGRREKDTYNQEITENITSARKSLQPMQDYLKRYGIRGSATWFPDLPKERGRSLRMQTRPSSGGKK